MIFRPTLLFTCLSPDNGHNYHKNVLFCVKSTQKVWKFIIKVLSLRKIHTGMIKKRKIVVMGGSFSPPTVAHFKLMKASIKGF